MWTITPETLDVLLIPGVMHDSPHELLADMESRHAEIDLLRSARPLKHGARVRVHNGTSEVLGRVSIAGAVNEIEPGGSALVRLRLETPAVLTRGNRFIIRAYSPPITIVLPFHPMNC